jgi:hypothetical protein
MKIIEKFKKPKEGQLAEAFQNKSMKFAFAYIENDTIVQVMPLVKCRDFLKEQIIFTYYDRHNSIYGFNTKDNSKNTKDYTGFIVSIPRKDEYQRFVDNFYILEEYEKKLGFTQVSEYSVINDTTLFVKGDVLWQQSCLLVSLYSLLLRTLSCRLKGSFVSILNGDDLGTNDGNMWVGIAKGFEKITSREQLVDLVAKEDLKDSDVSFIHNYTGVYYMLNVSSSLGSILTKSPVWVGNW